MFEKFVLVERKKSLSKRMIAIVLFLLMLLGFYLGTVISPYIFELPALGCGVGWFWLTFKSGVEYEYLYFDGDLKFTRIKDKRRRKRLVQLDMNKVLVIAPRGSESLAAYQNKLEVYRRDFTSGNRDAKVYELIYMDEDGTVSILFEPDGEMLDAMKVRYAKTIKE